MQTLKVLAGCAVAIAGASFVGVAVRMRPRRVNVEGTSMLPTLAPGDRLVVLKFARLRRGDIVALHDPQQPGRLLVKRIASVTAFGVEVRGDNPASSRDSRSFGPVAPSQLVGKVVYRYFPPARTGALKASAQ
jgi:nickel-type superoxide dismutase maturation protease